MDNTNAERQRRYIQRLKARANGGVTNATDTGEVARLKQGLLAAIEEITLLKAELAVATKGVTNAPHTDAGPVRSTPPPKLGGDGHRHAMDHPAERLRALWNSGRQKYQSFFAVLEEVQQTIGADALEMWCIRELKIGLDAITKVTGVLRAADEAVAKRTFADARRAEKTRRATARERSVSKAST